MSTTLESILKKAKHIEAGRFSYDAADESVKRSYSIQAALPDVREEYKRFLADYGVILNELSGAEATSAQAKTLFGVLQRGTLLAADLTRRILEQSAYKFDKPTDPYTNPECPQDASDYEKVVRYNYNSQERFSLVEYISMVKSLNQMLSGLDATHGEVVKKFVHDDIQTFIHITLAEIINHVSKKKKPSLQ